MHGEPRTVFEYDKHVRHGPKIHLVQRTKISNLIYGGIDASHPTDCATNNSHDS